VLTLRRTFLARAVVAVASPRLARASLARDPSRPPIAVTVCPHTVGRPSIGGGSVG